MTSVDSVEDFMDYVDSSKGKPWVECGLVEGAPEKAKAAYKKWVKEEEERIEAGILV